MKAPKDAEPSSTSEFLSQGQRNTSRQTDWTWDELVLACALVHRNGWREVKRTDRRAQELSDLLHAMGIHPQEARGDSFRNVSSVQRKTADLATAHPDYRGTTTKGGALTQKVVQEFLRRPEEMLAAADTIWKTITSGDAELLRAVSSPAPDEAEVVAPEGRIVERRHRFRERDPKLRAAKIKRVLAAGAPLACEVCAFDFLEFYGQHGSGYIEVHHRTPLHESGETETRLEDLALLCANCHQMSHRRLESTGTWPSVAELREVVNRGRSSP